MPERDDSSRLTLIDTARCRHCHRDVRLYAPEDGYVADYTWVCPWPDCKEGKKEPRIAMRVAGPIFPDTTEDD